MLIQQVVLLAIGSALASIVRSHGELGAACDIGALAVSTLGRSFAPVEAMPQWARAVVVIDILGQCRTQMPFVRAPTAPSVRVGRDV
ncbi:hypothetical protein ACFYUK_00890 [Nonomuraea wenchangensis]